VSLLLLSRTDVAGLMTPSDYLAAVEAAFRLGQTGLAYAPPPLHINGAGGAFHAKAAAIMTPRKRVALKLNSNFAGNPARGLPTIQGVILLCDAEDGKVLAAMDSIEITLRRTAATTALAARHLARADATTLAMIGCGAQAAPHAEALVQVLPFARGYAWDIDHDRASAYTVALSRTLGIAFTTAPSLRAATLDADVIVTCTTSRRAFLGEDAVLPGAFVAAVGADNSEKSEILPALMARAKVVTDVLEQCLAMGDLHHAVTAGAMTGADVYAGLGDIVSGAIAGRSNDHEIIVFDSTGTALQDVACAATIYERALQSAVGTPFALT